MGLPLDSTVGTAKSGKQQRLATYAEIILTHKSLIGGESFNALPKRNHAPLRPLRDGMEPVPYT